MPKFKCRRCGKSDEFSYDEGRTICHACDMKAMSRARGTAQDVYNIAISYPEGSAGRPVRLNIEPLEGNSKNRLVFEMTPDQFVRVISAQFTRMKPYESEEIRRLWKEDLESDEA